MYSNKECCSITDILIVIEFHVAVDLRTFTKNVNCRKNIYFAAIKLLALINCH